MGEVFGKANFTTTPTVSNYCLDPSLSWIIQARAIGIKLAKVVHKWVPFDIDGCKFTSMHDSISRNMVELNWFSMYLLKIRLFTLIVEGVRISVLPDSPKGKGRM